MVFHFNRNTVDCENYIFGPSHVNSFNGCIGCTIIDEVCNMAGKVVDIGDATFDAFVESNKIVLVDCWAAWCRPCLMLAPVVEELAEELAGKVGIAKLNVDDNPGISMRFSISAIPTMLVFKDGVMKEPLVGVRPKAEIKAYLMSL